MTMPPYRLVPFIGLFLLMICAAPDTARADRPAAFMKQAGLQLMAAARSRSHSMMTAVIQRYSDLPGIGLFSLGSYHTHLPRNRRSAYYESVARFMARYFIDQAGKFQVAKFQVVKQSTKTKWGFKVDSQVTLTNGEIHRLRWDVVPRSGSYKVRDVSIVGVWITPISMVSQQKNLFVDYIRDNDGKISALLWALEN
ncbi:MAG: ABC transporter substrate-binding protein [Hyphomicrobiaceae bacterium]|nr:ABC transporter substrate-binding protein [Hyphomicrobiaceae bacterium]